MAATPSSYSKYILLIGLPVLTFASLAALWWKKKGEKKRTYEEMGRVSELFIYPVKSCKGIRVTEAKCFKEGMEFDRYASVIVLRLNLLLMKHGDQWGSDYESLVLPVASLSVDKLPENGS